MTANKYYGNNASAGPHRRTTRRQATGGYMEQTSGADIEMDDRTSIKDNDSGPEDGKGGFGVAVTVYGQGAHTKDRLGSEEMILQGGGGILTLQTTDVSVRRH